MIQNQKQKNNNLVVGLDCSTTGIKAIAFNNRGQIEASAHELIPLFSPKPNYYEQNADDWWRSTKKALLSVTNQIDPQRISALAISNQRETFVALDKNDNSIRPSIIWLDERCKNEVEPFAQKIGKNKIHRITGKPVDYAPVVYRLVWMKKYEPKLFAKIAMICDVHSFITSKLTGTFKTSSASADPLGLLDMKRHKWSPVILKALGLKENQLPEVYKPGTTLGNISNEISKLTGLSLNTLVIAGGGDGQAAGLGSNVLISERAYLNIGTAVVSGIYGSEYKTGKEFRTMGSLSESGYYYECSLRAGTFEIDWFIKNILNIDPTKQTGIYKHLEEEAENISPGSDGILHVPYLCGVMNPYWDINAKGVFTGLSSHHKRGHLYRSILEGIAFEMHFALNAVEMKIGIKVKDLIAIGGGARSDLWRRIFADITGKNICIPETTEASALGAAVAAAVGIGWYKTFKEAAHYMTGIKKVIKPDSKCRQIYSRIFEDYKRIYPQLKIITSRRAWV